MAILKDHCGIIIELPLSAFLPASEKVSLEVSFSVLGHQTNKFDCHIAKSYLAYSHLTVLMLHTLTVCVVYATTSTKRLTPS